MSESVARACGNDVQDNAKTRGRKNDYALSSGWLSRLQASTEVTSSQAQLERPRTVASKPGNSSAKLYRRN